MIYMIYTPQDRTLVQNFVHKLSINANFVYAPAGLHAGSEVWKEKVAKDIQSCKIAVLVMTVRSAKDSSVMWRIQTALSNGLLFLPVFLARSEGEYAELDTFMHNPDATSETILALMELIASYQTWTYRIRAEEISTSSFDDVQLEDIRSILANHIPTLICFLSYSRKDTEFTVKLAEDLRKANVKVWRDAENIPAGTNWDREIEKAIKECTHLILVASPNSVESENVMDEISLAINKGKTVIPVMIEKCELPMRVHRAQWVDFRDDYEQSLSNLLEQLGARESK